MINPHKPAHHLSAWMMSRAYYVIVTCLAVAVLCLAGSAAALASRNPLVGTRVLWIGDSITQAGDYVSFVEYSLDKLYPKDDIDFVSVGLASETADCLSEKAHPFPRPCVADRLQRSLDLVKPNVVVACYGMNDGLYHPQSLEGMKDFQKGILNLIAISHKAHAQVIILTSTPFDPLPVHTLRTSGASDYSYLNPYAGYDDTLADYAHWEKSISRKAGITTIDLHTPIDTYLHQQRIHSPEFSFAKDGIHPDLTGHLLMARIILKALGIKPSKKTLQEELAADEKDPLFALVEEHREIRSNGWLPYIGYTRDKTVKTSSVSDAEKRSQELQLRIDELRNQ